MLLFIKLKIFLFFYQVESISRKDGKDREKNPEKTVPKIL